jgi:hypothetical protein
MTLTPKQKEQAQHAKERGERRVFIQFTPEQRKAYRETIEQELAGKDQNIAHARKIMAAADLPGFFGDVRRAILLLRPSVGDLATAIGVEPRVLSDFQAGDADLPAAALDRLIETLGLRLMQDIPR